MDANVAGIAASGHPQILPTLGHEDSVRNAEILARLQPARLGVLTVVPLVLGFRIVVDVDVDGLVEHGDLVGELPASEVVVEVQLVFTDDAPRFPHTHQAPCGDVLHVLAAGHVLTEEAEVLAGKLSATHHSVAQAAAA